MDTTTIQTIHIMFNFNANPIKQSALAGNSRNGNSLFFAGPNNMSNNNPFAFASPACLFTLNYNYRNAFARQVVSRIRNLFSNFHWFDSQLHGWIGRAHTLQLK